MGNNAKLVAQLKALENVPWVCPVAAAETIADIAREKVPVDTGYLQSSIKARHYAHFSKIEVRAPYAGYVEFGTWKMKAQPYLRPAIDEQQRRILAAVAEAMNDEIKVAVKGGWVPAQYNPTVGRPKKRSK